jgi:hypothetical protein
MLVHRCYSINSDGKTNEQGNIKTKNKKKEEEQEKKEEK